MGVKKLFKSADYVAFLKEQYNNKSPYWYGTVGVKCTTALLNSKKKQYPSHYTASRMSKYKQNIKDGLYCADCVGGAAKWPVWSDLGAHSTKYKSNGLPDLSANGFFDWAKSQGAKWGAIKTIPRNQPGVHVRYNGHIGTYIGNGEVIEWRGFAYGCVITKLDDRKWTHWVENPFVEYGEAAKTPAAPKPVAKDPTKVEVYNGQWNIRTAPSKTAKIIGYAKKGDKFIYQGQEKSGWYLIEYKNQNAWISGRGSKLI